MPTRPSNSSTDQEATSLRAPTWSSSWPSEHVHSSSLVFNHVARLKREREQEEGMCRGCASSARARLIRPAGCYHDLARQHGEHELDSSPEGAGHHHQHSEHDLRPPHVRPRAPRARSRSSERDLDVLSMMKRWRSRSSSLLYLSLKPPEPPTDKKRDYIFTCLTY